MSIDMTSHMDAALQSLSLDSHDTMPPQGLSQKKLRRSRAKQTSNADDDKKTTSCQVRRRIEHLLTLRELKETYDTTPGIDEDYQY